MAEGSWFVYRSPYEGPSGRRVRRLHVEGDPLTQIRVDEHSVRAATADDEVDLAYYFLDDALAAASDHTAYLLLDDWRLPVTFGGDGGFHEPAGVQRLTTPPRRDRGDLRDRAQARGPLHSFVGAGPAFGSRRCPAARAGHAPPFGAARPRRPWLARHAADPALPGRTCGQADRPIVAPVHSPGGRLLEHLAGARRG